MIGIINSDYSDLQILRQ